MKIAVIAIVAAILASVGCVNPMDIPSSPRESRSENQTGRLDIPFDQKYAIESCAEKGMRLPTVRELLHHYGAKQDQFRETAFPDRPWTDSQVSDEWATVSKEGFYPIFKQGSDSETVAVDFYLKYLEPMIPILVWTSSVTPRGPTGAGAYVFSGKDGNVSPYDPRQNLMSDTSAICGVECVSD
jgi:hypothetical protein